MEIIKKLGHIAGGYETLTIDDTEGGTGFTSSKIRPTSGDFKGKACQKAIVTVENEGIRYTLDGTAPVTGTASASTHGHLVAAGGSFVIEHPKNVSNFLAISVSTTDAWLRVTYEF